MGSISENHISVSNFDAEAQRVRKLHKWMEARSNDMQLGVWIGILLCCSTSRRGERSEAAEAMA